MRRSFSGLAKRPMDQRDSVQHNVKDTESGGLG